MFYISVLSKVTYLRIFLSIYDYFPLCLLLYVTLSATALGFPVSTHYISPAAIKVDGSVRKSNLQRSCP
jgi:hypothetical protein